jgi:hypothetical protein
VFVWPLCIDPFNAYASCQDHPAFGLGTNASEATTSSLFVLICCVITNERRRRADEPDGRIKVTKCITGSVGLPHISSDKDTFDWKAVVDVWYLFHQNIFVIL